MRKPLQILGFSICFKTRPGMERHCRVCWSGISSKNIQRRAGLAPALLPMEGFTMWKWFSRKKLETAPKHKCPCCGYYTIADDHGFPCFGDICPVCFWEIDALAEPNEPSDSNHGLTLLQAQENYQTFGACVKSMLKHVRKPKSDELYGIDD